MLSKKECKVCKLFKVHIKDGNPTGNGYKYRDLNGSTWNGKTCPDCKKIKRNKDYTPKHAGKPCEICGKPLTKSKQKYCSRKCQNQTPARKLARKLYKKSEKDKKARRESKRLRKRTERQRKLKCVKWSEIAKWYDKCPENHVVDHIIPLNGENVSGLHVPWNFQYLTGDDNGEKSNKFDGTYNNESWRS